MNILPKRWSVKPIVLNAKGKIVCTISYDNEHHITGEGIAKAIIRIEVDKDYLSGVKEALEQLTGFSKIVEEDATFLRVMLIVASDVSRYGTLQGVKNILQPKIYEISQQLLPQKHRWSRGRPYAER